MNTCFNAPFDPGLRRGFDKAAAIIVAAGTGQRFGSERPKQYSLLQGKPILWHSVKTFSDHPQVAEVMIVHHPEHTDYLAPILAEFPHVLTSVGGDTRQQSVLRGLEALSLRGAPRRGNPETLAPESLDCFAGARNDKVLVHDAARPFVSTELISRVIVAEAPAVLPAIAVTDTVRHKQQGLLDRTALYAAQTPQGFDFQTILNLHQNADSEVTDDIALAEAAGIEVTVVEGDVANRKITRKEDMMQTQQPSSLRKEKSSPGNHKIPAFAGMTGIAVGNGYDVHAFVPHGGDDTTIKICGVSVECAMAIEGHSDGDVGLHALTDAILGAIGNGDIGEHFSSDNPKWKGADSELFLKEAIRLLHETGGTLSHCDITLIAQMPKLSPHRQAMRQRVAEICGVDLSQVSVKATTTDHLGFIGRKEGLAAMATATVVRF